MASKESNLSIVEEEREFLFGLIGLAQIDVRNVVTIASQMRTNEQFTNVVKEGYSDVVVSYGGLLSAKTKQFYDDLRENNGGRRLNGKLPGWSDTYDLRKEMSIDLNTALKYATDRPNLSDRLTTDSVTQLNDYSHTTVDFLGDQDPDFKQSQRVPRADACAFCRWKAYEFSTYTRAKDVDRLDNVKLHKSCRCIAAPGFSFTDEGYLNTSAQDLFADRFDKIMSENSLNPNSRRDLSEGLIFLREDFKYR